MLLEQEPHYGLGMDALVTTCSWISKAIMVWACSGDRLFLQHKCFSGLGMDAPVTACPWITNVIVVGAWMLR